MVSKFAESLWVEYFRPHTINDIVMPDEYKKYFKKMIADGVTR